MASPNGQQPQSIDVLGQRVSALEISVGKLANTLDNFIQRAQEAGKTQWPLIIGAISVGYMIMGGIGYLAYNPILSSLSDARADIKVLGLNDVALKDFIIERYITRNEVDSRGKRAEEDRKRVDDRILRIEQYLSDKVVARPEHEEKWRSSEQRFADMQRQLDEIKRQQGETYTARDAILDLKKEVEDLRRRGWSAQP